MNLDDKLDHIANAVERLIRQEMKPPDDSYHRMLLKALARILMKRGKQETMTKRETRLLNYAITFMLDNIDDEMATDLETDTDALEKELVKLGNRILDA